MPPATPADLCFLTALEMRELIRRKHVSVLELVTAHVEQIERLNPEVNAIVTPLLEQALDEAREADERIARGDAVGPLHGLPVAHKDLHETKGVRTTFGSRLFADYVPPHDAILVERTRNAGAILIGKTNTPELGAGSQTFNAVFGSTCNPYDPARTCGGSSGGSAVALACGMTPLAGGSDMGGSLRNPAAFCNVVGLRPSPGRVPQRDRRLAWSPLSVDGPMARTVADTALLLSVIAGPDPRCPIAIAQPGTPFAAPLDRDFRGVRIAWAKDLGGVPFASSIREVVNAHCNVFESLGCIVEEAEPDFRDADEIFKTLRAFHFEAQFGDLPPARRGLLKDTIVQELERGARLTGHDIGRAESKRSHLYERVQRFLERYEYFVLPVTQVPPFDIHQPFVTEIDGRKMESYIDWMKSCYFISITGNPAISVPCGFTPDGLPVGLQIVGRHQAEWSILQLAHAFEQATQAGRRRPPLAA